MAKNLLDRAQGLSDRGAYGELVSLLEPQLPIYRESARYYRLLGAACLRTGDLGGAYTYLKRAEQLEPEDLGTLLHLGVLHLRQGEGQKAAEAFLRALELSPRSPEALRALSFMKREGFEDLAQDLGPRGGLDRFLPRRRPYRHLLVPALALVATVALLGLLLPLGLGALRAAQAARGPRPEVAAVDLSPAERQTPVETGGSYRFVLTEKEALGDFEKAKAFFQAYRDNAALVLLNRLLASNVTPTLKEKARTLKSFVAPPDFRTLKDVPTYATVMADPGLYDGCAVAWKGAAANIAASPAGGVDFHFLVGYVDQKRLEGILPVHLAADPALVPASGPFELLAILRTDSQGPRLEGVAIHDLTKAAP